MPLITLFTAPKSFTDPHISLIQRNSLRNWQALGDEVEVVVVGDDPGIAKACKSLGVRHIPDVACNDLGTPLISSIFELTRRETTSPFLVYSNADILFLPDLLETVHTLADREKHFLAVGQRWDLNIKEDLAFIKDWAAQLRKRIADQGELHGQTGSDYFIFPRACFTNIPNFAVGRAGWDNWMIFRARWQHWPVVDATKAITIAHQNHDYAHLPGGLKHFYQPESKENVKKAGGLQAIFRLTDATHTVENGTLKRRRLNWKTFWREVEILPLVGLHSHVLGWLSYAVFHPIKAFKVVRGWLTYRSKDRQKRQE
jgi:hypothetical protein